MPTEAAPVAEPSDTPAPAFGFAEDLTDRMRSAAVAGKFPFDGEPKYERLFTDICRALCRRQSNHVLLVGERGVGQRMVLVELARRCAGGHFPLLEDWHFLLVDCRYVTPDESRLRLTEILAEAMRHERVILCVDGFVRLLRSDRQGTNKGLLLSALSSADCRVIGLLAPHDYEELVSDDVEMQEFFGRIDLEEPSLDIALKVLQHFQLGLEREFGVTIEDEAVRQAAVLSHNYILNERLPGKALKVLQRVCEDRDFEQKQDGTLRTRVGVEDVIAMVSRQSGVPPETLRGIAERTDYERSLSEVVFGQEQAVREIALELGLIKAGMTDPDKPASVMMFVGQTGTGKTEMAKALARFYSTSKRLRTYTLGNFVEPHSVAGIIGVPPGYMGHDQGGRLVNDLNADPYCVFLLDEADKAHPDVLQPFLNLFDEGWVRDQRGVVAFANKAIFILTTNVGQRMIMDWVEQGKSMPEIAEQMKEALAQIRHSKSNRPVFSPEFLARIKRVVVFRPLDHDCMRSICRKLVEEIRHSWELRWGKQLRVAEELMEHIAEKAHQANAKSRGREGGRIVRKLIAELIESPVQRHISEHSSEYSACRTVEVAFENTAAQESSVPKVTTRFAET